MRCLRIQFLCLVVLVLAGGLRADELLDKAVVRGGMSIQLPRGWTVDDSRNSRTLLVARAPLKDKDETGEFGSAMTISIGPATKPDGKAILATLTRDYKNFKVLDEAKDVQISEISGISLGGSFQSGAVKLRMRQYVLTDGKRGYVVTAVALESTWDQYQGMVEAAVETFRIVDAEKK